MTLKKSHKTIIIPKKVSNIAILDNFNANDALCSVIKKLLRETSFPVISN